MLLKKIAKQLLFISRIPKLCAILQLVATPFNLTRYFIVISFVNMDKHLTLMTGRYTITLNI